jgi:hypothetical protein
LDPPNVLELCFDLSGERKLAAGLQFDLSLQMNIGNGSAKTTRLARGVVGKSLELGLLFSEELLNARMLLCRALY